MKITIFTIPSFRCWFGLLKGILIEPMGLNLLERSTTMTTIHRLSFEYFHNFMYVSRVDFRCESANDFSVAQSFGYFTSMSATRKIPGICYFCIRCKGPFNVVNCFDVLPN